LCVTPLGLGPLAFPPSRLVRACLPAVQDG